MSTRCVFLTQSREIRCTSASSPISQNFKNLQFQNLQSPFTSLWIFVSPYIFETNHFQRVSKISRIFSFQISDPHSKVFAFLKIHKFSKRNMFKTFKNFSFKICSLHSKVFVFLKIDKISKPNMFNNFQNGFRTLRGDFSVFREGSPDFFQESCGG